MQLFKLRAKDPAAGTIQILSGSTKSAKIVKKCESQTQTENFSDKNDSAIESDKIGSKNCDGTHKNVVDWINNVEMDSKDGPFRGFSPVMESTRIPAEMDDQNSCDVSVIRGTVPTDQLNASIMTTSDDVKFDVIDKSAAKNDHDEIVLISSDSDMPLAKLVTKETSSKSKKLNKIPKRRPSIAVPLKTSIVSIKNKKIRRLSVVDVPSVSRDHQPAPLRKSSRLVGKKRQSYAGMCLVSQKFNKFIAI